MSQQELEIPNISEVTFTAPSYYLPINKLYSVSSIRKTITLDEWNNNTFDIVNLYDLSLYLRLPTHIVANVFNYKHLLQTKLIVRGKRAVYKSGYFLKKIQEVIRDELTNYYNEIDTSHILAYIPNKNYLKTIEEVSGSYDILISLDIKKYYDSISAAHIKFTLINVCGFSETAANIVTHFLTVNKQHPLFKYKGSFLQQGSPASSVVSNLVGYLFVDNNVINVLENLKNKYANANFSINYFRYCDNLYLGIKGDKDLNILKELVDEIRNSLKLSQFLTHKLHIIGKNHPKLSQKILGVTVNNTMKISEASFQIKRKDVLRLIYSTPKGLFKELLNVYNNATSEVIDTEVDIYGVGRCALGLQSLTAQIRYMALVNKKQGYELLNILSIISEIFNLMSNNGENPQPTYLVPIYDVEKSNVDALVEKCYAEMEDAPDSSIVTYRIKNQLNSIIPIKEEEPLVPQLKSIAIGEDVDIYKLFKRLEKIGTTTYVYLPKVGDSTEESDSLTLFINVPTYSDLKVNVMLADPSSNTSKRSVSYSTVEMNLIEYYKTFLRGKEVLLTKMEVSSVARAIYGLPVRNTVVALKFTGNVSALRNLYEAQIEISNQFVGAEDLGTLKRNLFA